MRGAHFLPTKCHPLSFDHRNIEINNTEIPSLCTRLFIGDNKAIVCTVNGTRTVYKCRNLKSSYLLRELEFWNLRGARGVRYKSRLRIGPTVTLLPDSRARGIRKQNTGICPHPRLHVGGSAFQPGNARIRPSTLLDIPILQLKQK